MGRLASFTARLASFTAPHPTSFTAAEGAPRRGPSPVLAHSPPSPLPHSQPSKALLGEARPKKLSEMLKMGHATFTADDSRELSSFTSPPKEPGERPRRFPAGDCS